MVYTTIDIKKLGVVKKHCINRKMTLKDFINGLIEISIIANGDPEIRKEYGEQDEHND